MKSKKYYSSQYEATPQLHGKKGRWLKYNYKYKGDYFKYDVSDQKLLKIRIVFLAVTLLCAALFVGAGLLNTDGTRRMWVSLPYISMFLPLAVMAYDCVKQFFAQREMTEKERDSVVEELLKSTFGLVITSGLTIVGTIVFLLTEQVQKIANELLFLGMIFLVFIVSFVMWKYQRSLPVIIVKQNTHKEDQ